MTTVLIIIGAVWTALAAGLAYTLGRTVALRERQVPTWGSPPTDRLPVHPRPGKRPAGYRTIMVPPLPPVER